MESKTKLTWAEQFILDHQDDPEYIKIGVMSDISEWLFVYLEDNNITRTELAKRMGVSRAYVTKLLSGTYNYTIETLIKIATALDLDLKVEFTPKKKAGKKKAKYNHDHPVKKVAEG